MCTHVYPNWEIILFSQNGNNMLNKSCQIFGNPLPRRPPHALNLHMGGQKHFKLKKLLFFA